MKTCIRLFVNNGRLYFKESIHLHLWVRHESANNSADHGNPKVAHLPFLLGAEVHTAHKHQHNGQQGLHYELPESDVGLFFDDVGAGRAPGFLRLLLLGTLGVYIRHFQASLTAAFHSV